MNCANPLQLARVLIDAALIAHLSQNELKIFLVLLRQTLTYTKTADPLTTKRIAQLSHIRKDRVLPAINRLLQTQIFQTQAHPLYETEYFINPQYLNTPPIPKNRTTSPKTEIPPEKRVHTTKTYTTVNLNTTTGSRDVPLSTSTHATTEALPYPKTFSSTEQHQAAQILDGLSPQAAHDCLQILNQALTTNKIQKPLAYLYQLVKAARAGTLDTSTLQKPDEYSTKIHNPIHHESLQQLQAELYSLDQLFQRSRLPMDTQTAAHRAKLVEKINTQLLT